MISLDLCLDEDPPPVLHEIPGSSGCSMLPAFVRATASAERAWLVKRGDLELRGNEGKYFIFQGPVQEPPPSQRLSWLFPVHLGRNDSSSFVSIESSPTLTYITVP